MKKMYILTLASALLSVCSHAQLTSKNVTVGNENRTYLEYLPVNFDPSNEEYSLLVILHGIGGTSDQMVAGGFNDVADTARVIALYPQALNNSFNISAWNNGTFLASSADDIGFMNALFDNYITEYNVAPERIYMSGFSMGSIMSYHLACAMNNRIAAVGCLAGTMATSDIAACDPDYATPVIHMHGTADGTVPYDGTPLPSLSLVDQTMDFWQAVHACDADPTPIAIENTAADNITIDRFVYDNCSTEGALELWRLNGADHIYLYQPLNDITQMIETWLFLRKWSHPNPLPVGVEEVSQKSLRLYPNPASNQLNVESASVGNYTVFNQTGQRVARGFLQNGRNQIDLNRWAAGLYILSVEGSNEHSVFIVE